MLRKDTGYKYGYIRPVFCIAGCATKIHLKFSLLFLRVDRALQEEKNYAYNMKFSLAAWTFLLYFSTRSMGIPILDSSYSLKSRSETESRYDLKIPKTEISKTEKGHQEEGSRDMHGMYAALLKVHGLGSRLAGY